MVNYLNAILESSHDFPSDAIVAFRWRHPFIPLIYVYGKFPVRIFFVLLENDTKEKLFYENLHLVALISKIIQLIAICSSPSKQYPRGLELVAEASNILQALLISCANVSNTHDISDISSITSLVKEMLVKNQDIDELLPYHLKKALQGDIDQMVCAHKIVSFIRVLLEVDSFLQKSLSIGDSLPWNNLDRFSSPNFVEDILIKLLEKEITCFGMTHLLTEANWQLTLKAIALHSWEEAKLISVYLRKRSIIHRIRTILQVLSASLSLESLRSKLSSIVDLTSEPLSDLFKEFPHIRAVNLSSAEACLDRYKLFLFVLLQIFTLSGRLLHPKGIC